MFAADYTVMDQVLIATARETDFSRTVGNDEVSTSKYPRTDSWKILGGNMPH